MMCRQGLLPKLGSSCAVLACLCLLWSGPARAADEGPFGRSGKWQRVFTEEFDGTALDATRWITCFWWGVDGCTNRGNNDLQWYLPKNVAVKDGHLELSARPETVTTADGSSFEFTSGMVSTAAPFADPHPPPLVEAQYGYFEMRAKLPSGRGIFPAFWLEPSNYQHLPEVDVVETIGQEPDILTTNFHYRASGGNIVHIGHRTKTVDLTRDWHVYGLRWRPDALIWYLDGVEVWRFTKREFIPQTPMYLLLTLSVGGNWPGRPDRKTPFPSIFQVDYIRVWQPMG